MINFKFTRPILKIEIIPKQMGPSGETGKEERKWDRQQERVKEEARSKEGAREKEKNRYTPLPLVSVTLRGWNPDTA